MMSWIQISITSNSQHCEHIEQQLLDTGALSVTLKDAADNPVVEPAPGETPLWKQVVLTGLYDEACNTQQVCEQLEQTLSGLYDGLQVTSLEDQNWARTWMVDYKPMKFGDRLWVCPTHLESPDKHAITLRLDPGLAFGSGTHPTTGLCLEWLDKNLSGNETVLDYGCGSGILAIAALILGARKVSATDIDPQALLASKNNACTNAVGDKLLICQPAEVENQTVDVILANILSGTLVSLAPLLTGYAHNGSRLVLSGILEEQAEAVIAAYKPRFNLEIYSIKDGWACLHNK